MSSHMLRLLYMIILIFLTYQFHGTILFSLVFLFQYIKKQLPAEVCLIAKIELGC